MVHPLEAPGRDQAVEDEQAEGVVHAGGTEELREGDRDALPGLLLGVIVGGDHLGGVAGDGAEQESDEEGWHVQVVVPQGVQHVHHRVAEQEDQQGAHPHLPDGPPKHATTLLLWRQVELSDVLGHLLGIVVVILLLAVRVRRGAHLCSPRSLVASMVRQHPTAAGAGGREQLRRDPGRELPKVDVPGVVGVGAREELVELRLAHVVAHGLQHAVHLDPAEGPVAVRVEAVEDRAEDGVQLLLPLLRGP
mmetsp:Transcript_112752/g.306144  ORF Transcript_112752/g.306144 Transcript_112752/m.306144 type:complete len:249 (-) Transcript_112752:358-1104(-)